MNQAGSNLADRKELQIAVQGKRFYRWKGAGTKKFCSAEKWFGCCKAPSLQGVAGIYQTGDLTKVIPDSLVQGSISGDDTMIKLHLGLLKWSLA